MAKPALSITPPTVTEDSGDPFEKSVEKVGGFGNKLFLSAVQANLNSASIDQKIKKAIEEQVALVLENPETVRLARMLEMAAEMFPVQFQTEGETQHANA